MGTLRTVLARHPRLVDAGLAVLLALFTGPAVLRGAGADEWIWFVAVHAPIAWRRRWPVGVFWAVFALAILAGAIVGVRVEGLYPESVVTVAVYTAARYGPRRQLVAIVAAIEVPALVVFVADGPHWTALGFVTSVLAATVLLGIAVRTRRAYMEELEERARRLERERDQQAQIAVAAERARIARDMHDIVAHNLAVMVALADGAALTAAAAPEQAAGTMHMVAATGREALGEMRRVLGLLREEGAGRAPQPGLDGIDALVERVRAAGVRVVLTVDGVPGEWGGGAGVAVYRIVQEALTNTLKHAGAEASAQVRLRYGDGGAEVEVVDDGGRRVPAPAAGGGHGLTGMAERSAAYGGEVTAGPREGARGWRVHARLRFDDGGSA
ncbi:sensor histidine kinase [Phytohabitans houttuyneae]|uniref:histidine kinase n=1 Tax=Phytohabitans houttuyneae TaxID=1076126 RepID=A0A6V8KA46_9ACTN|nr:histidine kinase [Phytohabitans houttuyneae]GFJ78597.1 two-component sensor histidine kinase [Phytohabitans houttuyneae]